MDNEQPAMENDQPAMENDQSTMHHDQDSAEFRTSDAAFEPVPPESDDTAATGEPDDDSDAPIRLDDLAPDAEAGAETVAVGPGTEPIRAESVSVYQSGAQSIEAATVSITQGGAAQVKADHLSVSQGGVALARAQQLTVQSESSAFAVYAENATVEEGANVFLLISPSVSGEVRPVLDWRAALAIGGGFALVLSILRRLR